VKKHIVIICLALVMLPLRGQTQKQHPLSDALVKRLPVAYQEEARKLISLSDEQEFYITALSDEELRMEAFYLIAGKPEGPAFLKEQLEKEPSGAVRASMIPALQRYFSHNPEDRTILEPEQRNTFRLRDADAGSQSRVVAERRQSALPGRRTAIDPIGRQVHFLNI
jgi:hypothetical protein